MNTGSADERKLLNDVARIASALERIARALEEQTFGATVEDVRATAAALARDARGGP